MRSRHQRLFNLPTAELEPGCFDTVRCPRGCGEFLAFRSDPMSGSAEERCWTCDPAWRRVVPRYPERRAEGKAAARPLTQPLATDAHRVRHRETLFARIPQAPRAISRPDLLRFVPGNAKAADRVLRKLCADGTIASEMRGRTLFVWRPAA